MMTLINCKICKKLIVRGETSLCPECLLRQQEDIHLLKDYLSKNPHASALETSRDTGVSYQLIRAVIEDAYRADMLAERTGVIKRS